MIAYRASSSLLGSSRWILPSIIPSTSTSTSISSSTLRSFHLTSTSSQESQLRSEFEIDSDEETALPGSIPTSSFSSPSSTLSSTSSSFRKDSISTRSNSTDSNAPRHRLHVQTTRNNTILTLTTPSGDPLASASGGTAGFKKAQRSGYEAAYRAAFQIFNSINNNNRKWGLDSIEIIWKGFGQGREAVFRALMAQEGSEVRSKIAKMIDGTPIKVGGVRPKKRRSEFVG